MRRAILRWLSLLAGMLIMLSVGIHPMFSVYAPYMKQQLGYSQTETNLCAAAVSLGLSLVIIPGYISDRFGCRYGTVYGAAFLFTGYFMIWWSIQKIVWSHYLLMAFYHVLVGNGVISAYSAVLKIVVKNFDVKHRGKVVGITLFLYGLSAAIMAQVYHGLFKPRILNFILFLALFAPSVILFCTIFLQTLEPEYSAEEKQQLVSEVSEEEIQFEEKTGWELLVTPNYWILFIILAVSNGTVRLLTGNVGSLVISYGYENGTQDILITLQSIGSSVGRLSSGFVVDIVRRYLSVATLIFLVCIITFFNQVLFIFGIEIWALCLAAALCGLCYGSMVSVMPNYVADEWGTNNFGTNWGQLFPSIVIGSFLIGSFLPGAIYDAQVPKGSNLCKGVNCYRWSFVATAILNFLSAILALILIWMYKRKLQRALHIAQQKESDGTTVN